MLSDAPDIAQLDLALSQTANSLTQHCPGQYTAEPSAVPDSAQLDSALSRTVPLSWTVLSWTQQCSAGHSFGKFGLFISYSYSFMTNK